MTTHILKREIQIDINKSALIRTMNTVKKTESLSLVEL